MTDTADDKPDTTVVPASASTAPPVPLAGVPVTPVPNAAVAIGPAVPGPDHYVTETSLNKETSSDAPPLPEATKNASGA